jgi:ATP-dependent Lhr-like helicase
VVDVGHVRARDLALELPPVPLEAVMPNEVWERVYDRMAELVVLHRTTLIFVNTRRMAERVARHLADRLGAEHVAAHHGSLAKEYRLDAEQRLKARRPAGADRHRVAGTGHRHRRRRPGLPGRLAAQHRRFAAARGRSGHQVGGMPKGRLFPTSRDDLIECAALLDCVRRGELDALRIPAGAAGRAGAADRRRSGQPRMERGRTVRAGAPRPPYAQLERAQLRRRAAHAGRRLHQPQRRARRLPAPRRRHPARCAGGAAASSTAVTSGGTIPDNADYTVLLEPQGQSVGTVNEDFAVESLAGDVFQLGNTSYRIMRSKPARCAWRTRTAPRPTFPFWLGEAPGRSDELSPAWRGCAARSTGSSRTGRCRTTGERAKRPHRPRGRWLIEHLGLNEDAARQIVDYLARARAALGALPTQDTLVMERFFDESGGMQLVLHSPFGSRINRAWGLALRKRFCRTFNFELQAAATEDAIVLSLSDQPQLPARRSLALPALGHCGAYPGAGLLDAPLFNVRWRWNATTALALPRYAGGRKVAPQLQRMKSDDLLAAVFPDQAACLENVVGERELPSHPLVDQTSTTACTRRWTAKAGSRCCAAWKRARCGCCRATCRRPRRWRWKSSTPALRLPRRRAAGRAPHAGRDEPPLDRSRLHRRPGRARRRTPSPAWPTKPGRRRATATKCTKRWWRWPASPSAEAPQRRLAGMAGEALAESGRATACARPRIRAPTCGWRWNGWPACRPPIPRRRHAGAGDPRQLRRNGDEDWTRDAALVEIMRARLSGFGPLPLAPSRPRWRCPRAPPPSP